MPFPFYRQLNIMDCGPACLRMVAMHYGRHFEMQGLRQKAGLSREGVSLLGISEAAELIGLRSRAVEITYETLVKEAPLPCIVHWDQSHFVIVYKAASDRVKIADPAKGLLTLRKTAFLEHWTSEKGMFEGIALLLEPTTAFYEQDHEKIRGITYFSLFQYLFAYKKLIFQLFLGLVTSSVLLLILPFLTESVVDVGIGTQDISFVYLVLAAQMTLLMGQTVVEFVRSWVLLHISTRVNLNILSDFLVKLMKLPVSYFEGKMTGDILQRVEDHHRIESFLTGNSLSFFFSLFNMVIFSVVLAIFNLTIFYVYTVTTVLYILWITVFLKRRKILDYQHFSLASTSHNLLIQFISGMPDIKIANSEQFKRWDWETNQAKIFKLNNRTLALNQYQGAGAFFINQGKNIFITFISATAVIDGRLSFGGMLAIQTIIGQLNGPLEQLIQFFQSAQDAKIGLERLNDVQTLEDEQVNIEYKLNFIPQNKAIHLRSVSFKYPGAGAEDVLSDVQITIPEGKTTAIVGSSGSGKTTLLKLLLNFYIPTRGEVRIGETNLNNISHKLWRSLCGVVLQDSFIFSDTIAGNIAVGEEIPNMQQLYVAMQMANISDFVDGLPLGLFTKIGADGNGISQGQKQRLLIARAIYKNPQYLFLDEATNALDATNETEIMHHMETFFKGRTVVIVAHRLSTVKNADQIIVLDKGMVVEVGTHIALTHAQGKYFNLVKNQLELGE